MFSGILKNWKQFGTVQASYGCLVGHVCTGVRISVFAPWLCNTSVSGLNEYTQYTDGCLLKRGTDWYPFCLGGGTGRGVWGVGGGSGGSHSRSKLGRAFLQKFSCLLSETLFNPFIYVILLFLCFSFAFLQKQVWQFPSRHKLHGISVDSTELCQRLFDARTTHLFVTPNCWQWRFVWFG